MQAENVFQRERMNFENFPQLADHVGRTETLAEVGAEIGLDPAEVASTLTSDAYAREVRADIAEARSFGINGVPFFIFDRTYAVSGAQDPNLLARAIRQVSEEINAQAAE